MNNQNFFWGTTLTYSIGFLCLRAISFLLLPLYTNLLSPEEAGFIFIIYTILAILNTLYNHGMDSAILKYYKSEQSKSVISTSILYSIIFSIFLSLFLLFIRYTFISYSLPIPWALSIDISVLF